MQKLRIGQKILKKVESPRMVMFVILNLCALAAFFSSFALARFGGISQMWLRYGIAVICGYVMFFLIMQLWLTFFLQRHAARIAHEVMPSSSATDAPLLAPGLQPDAGKKPKSRSGSYTDPGLAHFDLDVDDVEGVSDSVGVDADIGGDGEGLVVLVLLAIALSFLIIAGLFVAAAPAFLVEVIGSALLGSGAYRGLVRSGGEAWWETVFRRSRWHALGMFATFVIGGAALQMLRPDAVTIGDVLRGLW